MSLSTSTKKLIQKINERSHDLDPTTQSNYKNFKVNHTELTLDVSFNSKTIDGLVKYDLTNLTNIDELILDTRALTIKSVIVNGSKVSFKLSNPVPIYGSALIIPLPTATSLKVDIEFQTTDKCTAIQFIQGDTGPYVFSQCQAIHARSLFPCFDTPGVKSPYKFIGKSPTKVTMSGRPQPSNEPNTYYFDQPIPIPSYLVSITSGNLFKAPIGPRSDVYCEKPNLKNCQWEFEKDMENYLQIAESLVFEYEWKRFDSLVLPSSFPYGGMEIPNMTQLTPTLISGDRTQTKVMAHELAHSWSGNLVTNTSWEHFWLNEGWTVYLERRIVGAIGAQEAKLAGKSDEEAEQIGEQIRHFDIIGGWNALVETCETFNPDFTKLVWNLKGQDPDDAFSRIPYEKGFFFLFQLENKVGGKKEFDHFIKYYFEKYRYQSLNTSSFVETLYEFYEPRGKKDVLDTINWDKELFVSGLPEKPYMDTTLADQVYSYGNKWVEYIKTSQNFDNIPFKEEDLDSYQGEQDMLFIEYLVEKFKNLDVPPELIKKFPSIYPTYAASKNGEILSPWNELLIMHGDYQSTDQLVKDFSNWLSVTGRMKYARPGYKVLKNGISLEFAVEQFNKHKEFYHPICRSMIEKDLGLV
ncbi:LAP2 [Candida pseudojiufengensis]|uniref:LAP2 n=1 Tax=Candida pseudojiufengensis TaxID=497109 RepID=UPI002225B0BA|nr:LAP2 [Candida pseudojiufengensis]KAI5963584.1 LAP2 [Candida pseudojiufengensis]